MTYTALQDKILQILLLLPGILAGFTFHEYAHAYVADKLGDKTPRFQGRLSLNPLVHIDPIGFLMILIIGFGWAKPVQTNPSAYKKYYKDDLKVSLAGPVANLILAFISAVFLALFIKFTGSMSMNENLRWIITRIFILSASINCTLFVLNLIPIPGFDGFHILRDLFPKFFYNIADTIYRYQLIIMVLFLASPLANYVIGVPSRYILSFIFNIVGRI
ncbi:site-2 protease family protein [Clostridium sp. YIM B02515]|uniref:Site-2 protease family protein n=1 Tax=Clostridium rhizosphaerae TaxID=2803861 RepID=A0ABS1TAQ3_9CLOT|nr:site-2 protease family protein [Clostridium rhizosphaerae]MBL4935721.1 site-2 protease family protein [Clostridium rhizosphaerae]